MEDKNNLIIEKAKTAKRESKYIEFKEKIDLNQPQDWCEIIKDIIAMANSGGGCILFGVKNNGTPSNTTPKLETDPAHVTDKIAKYTMQQFSNFDIQEIKKNNKNVIVLIVGSVSIPIIFVNPGTYDTGGGKQKTAFGKGTIYFRHGAKSEPGNSQDLKECVEREIERNKKFWLGNIRKVIEAPTGHRIKILPPEVVESGSQTAMPIKIVDDPKAPVFRKINPDQTHPHRQKEIVQIVNQKLSGKKTITSYDVQAIRKIHKIDQSKPNFYYKSKFASPQYSDAFAEWIVEQYEKDPLFFDEARKGCKKVINNGT